MEHPKISIIKGKSIDQKSNTKPRKNAKERPTSDPKRLSLKTHEDEDKKNTSNS